jgi:hypothetical protein
MLKKLFFLVPAILGPSLLLTGAWNSPPPVAPAAPPAFVAQPVDLNRELIGDGATGVQLLDRALARFGPARLSWLRTKIWQKMSDGQTEFEAEGTLELAPGQCARLDLAVRTAARKGRLLAVSDGHALAQVLHVGGGSPQITSALLPTVAPGQPNDSPDRLHFLQEKGCGGPAALLAGLRRQGSKFRLQTGTWQGRGVIHVRGEWMAEALAADQPAPPTRYVSLYLDAQTLWPHRLEWWACDAKERLRLVLQMEFRDPEFNRALPLAECARLFTYHPEAGD